MSHTPTIKPTLKQHLAWEKLKDKKTKFIFFGGAAGGGKTWLGCEWLLTNCYFYPGSKWFIGRKELKRLMASSYITFQKVCKYHKIPRDDWKYNGQYNYIEFKNGSRIDLLDLAYQPADPQYERLGSLEYTGGWIEEAGEIYGLAFDVLKSRIGRHMNKELGLTPKILSTLNPTKNWIYRDVYKPFKEGVLSQDTAFIQALYKDNPHTAETYAESLASISDKAMRERLMFGNWQYDDDPTRLVDFDAIIDMFTNPVEPSTQKYMVADIARFGSDKIVVACWRGYECYRIEWRNHQGINDTVTWLHDISVQERIPRSRVVVDEDGVGGGVKDFFVGVKGFVNNSSPILQKGQKENYQHLKAQCAYLLANKINERAIRVSTADEEIKDWIQEELEQLKQKDADKEGKLKIVGKDVMKEHLGRSPDFLDMLIMRMYFELSFSPEKVASHVPDWKGGYLRK